MTDHHNTVFDYYVAPQSGDGLQEGGDLGLHNAKARMKTLYQLLIPHTTLALCALFTTSF